MRHVILNLIASLALSASAADYYITADSQYPSQTTPIDGLYVGDSGTISVALKNDKTTRSVGSNETVTLWYGTNGLASDAIVSISATGTNVISFVSSNFPAASPNIPGYYTYGVNLGDKVYGTSKLYVRKNPTSGDPAALQLRSSRDYSLVYLYENVADYGPVRAGSGLTVTTNADGSVTYSVTSASPVWGEITGTLSNQTDLQNALNAKASSTDLTTHNTTNTAHSALFAAARTNATHINGVAVGTLTTQASQGATAYGWGDHATNDYAVTTGDTMTGPLLTTRNMTTTAPASDELVNASWVRSLAMQGGEWYLTGTVSNMTGRKTSNFVAMSATLPAQLTNSIASPVASSTYLLGGVSTNLYGSLRSPITCEIYANRVGGNTTTTIPLHPEIYYIYNGATNHLGDWSTGNQTITATTPTRYMFTVAFVEPTITGAVKLVAYIKTGTVSGTAAGLNFYGGGVYPSHLDVEGVAAGETAADVAADLAAHLANTSEAHPQSAVDAVRTLTTIAASQAAGTQTVSLAWGEVARVRILATNSGVVVKYDWPALPATNRVRFARLEHWNPNARSISYADTTYWSSNGTATATALALGKYAEVSIKGSTYYYAVRGMTNATELGAP